MRNAVYDYDYETALLPIMMKDVLAYSFGLFSPTL